MIRLHSVLRPRFFRRVAFGLVSALLASGAAAFAGAAGCSAYDEAAYVRDTIGGGDGSAPVDGARANDGAAARDGATSADGAVSDGASSGGGGGGGGADAADAAACTPPSGGDPCDTIPMLTVTQVVDGFGTDFCEVPAVPFDPTKGYIAAGVDVPTPTPMATLQAAYTIDGLAVFIHVDNGHPVEIAAAGEQVYAGDAVELYVSAAADELTGNASGDPGAGHYICSPPATASGSAVGYPFQTNDPNALEGAPLPAGNLKGRLLPGGLAYEMEFFIPWDFFAGNNSPAPGDKIGFDFGLDMRNPSIPDSDDDTAQAFYFERTHLMNSPCGSAPFPPFCDDRTWCTPTLE